MENKKQGRGGARKGAGRKKLPQKRQPVAFRVLPDTKAKLEVLKSKGFNVGLEFDKFISNLSV